MHVFNNRSIIAILSGGEGGGVYFVSYTHVTTDIHRAFPILSQLSNRGTLRFQNTWPAAARSAHP